jgi:adenylosuccinate lyase
MIVMSSTFDSYLSPFSWRYGSQEMRSIWSEKNKIRTWREIWCALAEVQASYGLVKPEQAADLCANIEKIDIERTLEIEKELRHDVMAEITAFGEQAPIGAGIIHLGATSTDIKDNAIAINCQRSLNLIIEKLDILLTILATRIEETRNQPIIAFTHLQPAEPSTLGYRFSVYAQDLIMDRQALTDIRHKLKGKGIRGAVGTAASFAEIIGKENLKAFDLQLSERLGIGFFDITTQTYPRKQDYLLLNALSSLGASLYKFAFDLRLMQSPVIFEWSEPFGKAQVGSSAMPFKKNPINAEKINSLARHLAQLPGTAWGNAAHSLLERTLDDSANRRTILPEGFLIADELLSTAIKILEGIQIHESRIGHNFAQYAPFAGVETVLMAACKKGANRQIMHEILRELSLKAWDAVASGHENPLFELIGNHEVIQGYLSNAELKRLQRVEEYTGLASEKAQAMSNRIREVVITTN